MCVVLCLLQVKRIVRVHPQAQRLVLTCIYFLASLGLDERQWQRCMLARMIGVDPEATGCVRSGHPERRNSPVSRRGGPILLQLHRVFPHHPGQAPAMHGTRPRNLRAPGSNPSSPAAREDNKTTYTTTTAESPRGRVAKPKDIQTSLAISPQAPTSTFIPPRPCEIQPVSFHHSLVQGSQFSRDRTREIF
jgi:hypothetical protein